MSNFSRGPLLKLANDICRKHGKAVSQKISVAVFLETGEWLNQSKSWIWLAEEHSRRTGSPLAVPAKKVGTGKGKPKHVREKKVFVPAIAPGFTSSPEWRALRFEALKMSNGCCVLCGRSQREHRVILHVDHITPKSKRPDMALLLSNLQVMCEDCNMGKGNRDDTDWR